MEFPNFVTADISHLENILANSSTSDSVQEKNNTYIDKKFKEDLTSKALHETSKTQIGAGSTGQPTGARADTSHALADARPLKRRLQQQQHPCAAKIPRMQGIDEDKEQEVESVEEEEDTDETDEDKEQEVESGEEDEVIVISDGENVARQDSPAQSPEAEVEDSDGETDCEILSPRQ